MLGRCKLVLKAKASETDVNHRGAFADRSDAWSKHGIARFSHQAASLTDNALVRLRKFG